MENARLAVAALELFVRQYRNWAKFRRISASSIARGLRRVVRHTGLRARLEIVRQRWIIDAAHNPEGAGMLAGWLQERRLDVRVAVFGVMKDKEWEPMLRVLAPHIGRWVMVIPKTARALPAGVLCRRARELGVLATNGSSVRRGLGIARKLAGRNGLVLITGSHYVAGEALTGLEGSGA